MALLEVKGIKKRFGKSEILKGIDFDLEKGEVLSIIGSSLYQFSRICRKRHNHRQRRTDL